MVNVYNNANKVFNLKKGLPIGVITWGAGAIGSTSVSTLIKDLRERFTDEDAPDSKEWVIRDGNYAIEEIASVVRRFMFDLYITAYRDWPSEHNPFLGFIVAGYSPGEDMAEEYLIHMQGEHCSQPTLLRPKEAPGITWNGEIEAVNRLVLGYAPGLPEVLRQNLGVPDQQIEPVMGILQQELAASLAQPAMPFQDAIDLAQFLVVMIIKFSRFIPGAPTVGGPRGRAELEKLFGTISLRPVLAGPSCQPSLRLRVSLCHLFVGVRRR